MADKTYVTMGATGHGDSSNRHKDDFYASPPDAAQWLLKLEPQLSDIWECACGAGHLAKVFDGARKLARASDLYDRGYGESGIDFCLFPQRWHGDIATNPPFKLSKEFILRALELIDNGRYVCMFLPIRYLEGQDRRKLFDAHPPVRVWISSKRLQCARFGDFDRYANAAIAFGWFVWQKGHAGKTELKWFN